MSATSSSETAVTVLVADDDPDLLALMTRRLHRAGFDVISAINGELALSGATASLPAVAVLDVSMPLMTGIEVARCLRNQATTRNMRIILVSAGNQRDIVDQVVLAIADGYIVKPFGAEDPVRSVRSVARYADAPAMRAESRAAFPR